jgi:hypothetical protein
MLVLAWHAPKKYSSPVECLMHLVFKLFFWLLELLYKLAYWIYRQMIYLSRLAVINLWKTR